MSHFIPFIWRRDGRGSDLSSYLPKYIWSGWIYLEFYSFIETTDCRLSRRTLSVCIVKFLLRPNTKAELRKGTKTLKTNVRIVIYWESVSNTPPDWLTARLLAYVWWWAWSIVCLHKAPLGCSFLVNVQHISVLIQILSWSRLGSPANNSLTLMTKMCCHLLKP